MAVPEGTLHYSDDCRYADEDRCQRWLPRVKRYCKNAWMLGNKGPDGSTEFVCRRHWEGSK